MCNRAEEAADRMSKLAKLASRYISTIGFSIGIGDVTPSEHLTAKKQLVLQEGYQKHASSSLCSPLLTNLFN